MSLFEVPNAVSPEAAVLLPVIESGATGMSLFEAPNAVALEIRFVSFSIPWRVHHPFMCVMRSIPSQRRVSFPITRAAA